MKDHTNVLLLALSTFPSDRNTKKSFMRQSNFIWDGKEYTGIYQLNPVPKMLADQLAQKQEYLDTHGGFREIFLVAEAVISLLKIDGIEAQGIYGVEFGRKDDGTDNNKIVDGSGGFHIFDFVSGMNEFLKLHVNLKNIRNQSNHALARNKNALTYVDEKITRYLEKLEKLCSF